MEGMEEKKVQREKERGEGEKWARYEGKHGLIYEVLWPRPFSLIFSQSGPLAALFKSLGSDADGSWQERKGNGTRAPAQIQTGGKYQLDLRLSLSVSPSFLSVFPFSRSHVSFQNGGEIRLHQAASRRCQERTLLGN